MANSEVAFCHSFSISCALCCLVRCVSCVVGVYTTPCSLGRTVLLGKLHGHGLCFEPLIQHGNKRKEAHFEGFGGTGIAQTRQRKAPRCGGKSDLRSSTEILQKYLCWQDLFNKASKAYKIESPWALGWQAVPPWNFSHPFWLKWGSVPILVSVGVFGFVCRLSTVLVLSTAVVVFVF